MATMAARGKAFSGSEKEEEKARSGANTFRRKFTCSSSAATCSNESEYQTGGGREMGRMPVASDVLLTYRGSPRMHGRDAGYSHAETRPCRTRCERV
eukprot:1206134-Pleurochrysis_carterae.AAC.1